MWNLTNSNHENLPNIDFEIPASSHKPFLSTSQSNKNELEELKQEVKGLQNHIQALNNTINNNQQHLHELQSQLNQLSRHIVTPSPDAHLSSRNIRDIRDITTLIFSTNTILLNIDKVSPDMFPDYLYSNPTLLASLLYLYEKTELTKPHVTSPTESLKFLLWALTFIDEKRTEKTQTAKFAKEIRSLKTQINGAEDVTDMQEDAKVLDNIFQSIEKTQEYIVAVVTDDS
jgi:uncharacterized coiled-coil DUF342 family protein